MIVFAALTPHSPLLLPSVNKGKIGKVEKTRQAMAELADELHATHPEVIVVLSSHGVQYDNAFAVNLHDHYRVDLSSFGDLISNTVYFPDISLIDAIQRTLRKKHVPLVLGSQETLDYGAAVPLLLLTNGWKRTCIVPISYSGGTAKEHYQFGEALREVLESTTRRVAVIASGDQSHALETHSPAGYAKEGPAYDAAVQSSIVNKNTAALLSLDPEDVAAAKECSYRSLLMLLGVLEHANYDPVIDSYEAPFGVGYLVAHFTLL